MNVARSPISSLNAAITVLVVCFASSLFAAKDNPSGLYVLISGKDSFGQLSDHPAISLSYVDGFRFKQTWGAIETTDNGYNWTELDNAVNAAAIAGKKIGISIGGGIGTPPWVMGGQTFSDGSTSNGSTVLTSQTATFTASDVDRIIVSENFPVGTKISSFINPTKVNTSLPASDSGNNNVVFSVLSRIAGRATPYVAGTYGGDSGIMPLPWSSYFISKFKEFIAVVGARYDSNVNVSYVVFTGVQLTTELYVSQGSQDAQALDGIADGDPEARTLSGAKAHNQDCGPPYSPCGAATQAWRANVQDIMQAFLNAFPSTAVNVAFAKPYDNGFLFASGDDAETTFEKWCHSSPRIGHVGYMCNSLAVDSSPTYPPNSYIIDNHGDSPAGWQMVSSAKAPDPNDPSGYRIGGNLNQALTTGATIGGTDPVLGDQGGRWVEVYEPDYVVGAENSCTAAQFRSRRAQLKAVSGPLTQ